MNEEERTNKFKSLSSFERKDLILKKMKAKVVDSWNGISAKNMKV